MSSELQFFPTAEGYVSVTNGDKFKYVYNYLDHLGNIRLSYTQEGGVFKILEENHYYPFGMKHANYNASIFDYVVIGGNSTLSSVSRSKFQFKYNGQEYQDELNLNITAMDFRQYDNALGRFNGVDLLAELDYSGSPYSFGFNNPVYFSDPSGLTAQEPPTDPPKRNGILLDDVEVKSNYRAPSYFSGVGMDMTGGGFSSFAGIPPVYRDYTGGIGSITPAGLISLQSDPIVAAMMKNYASYNLSNPFQSSEGVSLLFNGSTFSLMANGIAIFSVSAVSGRPLDDGSFSYSISRQKEKGVGPLPAGNYSIRPNSIQWWTDQSSTQRTLAFLGLVGIKAGRWPGGMYSWGVARTDIFPGESTVLYGRQGFTIHGGMSPGSAGCIDLTLNDLIFFRLLEHYQHLDCIPLQVKY